MSPGAKHIEAMTFPPLKLTIPRVGREVERLELASGLVLYLMEDHTLPVFDLQVAVRTGSLYTFRDKPGLAGFAGDQMREGGTKAYPPEELNRRLPSRFTFHEALSPNRTQASCILWEKRRMMNSAGRTAAMPISTIIRPSRMSCVVMVLPRPTLTKYAASGDEPARAPCCHKP